MALTDTPSHLVAIRQGAVRHDRIRVRAKHSNPMTVVTEFKNNKKWCEKKNPHRTSP
jgi:hypothetical protein